MLFRSYTYFYKSFPGTGLFFYVNVHMQYNADFNADINDCIKKITGYSSSNQHLGKLKSIYFIGDFNRSLLYQNIKITLPITSFNIYTTKGDRSYSLGDNDGNLNTTNVDNILQILF